MAAAKGLLLSLNRGALAEYGGHIKITRHWAYSLFHRMKYVQRKVTTSQSKYTATNFAEVKQKFLNDVVETVEMEEVCPELILNWDQTGIWIVPSSTWTMDREGVSHIEMVGTKDKRQITAVFCCTLQSDFPPVQLIYQGKTSRCHPKFRFPPGWYITHSLKHCSTKQTMVQYVHNIILPYAKLIRKLKQDDSASALVIMDNFKGQVTDAIHMLLEENNIFVALLPANTTNLLQPLDIAVNKPAKNYLWQQFQDWYSKQISEQLEGQDMANAVLESVDLSLPSMKELGAKWLTGMAEYLAANPQFMVNGFTRSGITHALDHNDDSNVVESPITNYGDDDEDSDYQVDSDSEDGLDDDEGLDDEEGLDDKESLDEEDLDDEEGPDNDEEEHLESPDDPEGVGQSDEIIVID